MDRTSLRRAVDEAFERTARGLLRWDDPHPPPDRIVAPEEYSRVSEPAKWRIVGARVDAWLDVLARHRLATVDLDVAVAWEEPPRVRVTRADVVRPSVQGGLALVVARSPIGAVDDAAVTLGVGLPTVVVNSIPDCGCDACDSGSAAVVGEVDTWIGGIVRGELRHLVGPAGTITVVGDQVRRASFKPDLTELVRDGGWTWAAGPVGDARPDRAPAADRSSRPFDVDAVLADPAGWREWSGQSWIE